MDKRNQTEDKVLKRAAKCFADELLRYFNITGTVSGIAPTESIHLELHRMYEDFNLIMDDGSWIHFEFQSSDGGVADLRRFRTYEAVTSQQYGVPVTTYVLYSGQIRQPKTELTEGLNTYRIHPILMSDRDANDLFENLQRKKDCGEPLTKEDLVPLTLSLLMGGTMPMEDRVTQTFRYLQEEPLEKEDQRNLEALTYALATKFLDQNAMKKLEGMIKMTELGQMLYNDGLADGIRQGLSQGISQGILSIARNLLGSVSDEFIIEKTGITPEQLQELKEEKESEKPTDNIT
ncbi:hypothetical protein [Mordavella massiliensis]|uniref:Rpn family recombination-promoting nuclease/putative transposase n=1 Tax=Mordavella massiliensis TaxID=1871024 RepID=A0A939BAY2_9CLOT|nr:hypothetical protein [Mordavella massiliensis]MBM6825804.1 hypothetical protein [Mordavella massiliensis]